MKEQGPERVKLARRRALMAAQREVASRVWGGWVGRTVPVRVDAPVPGRPGVWSGGVEQQGYEVDGVTYVRGAAGSAAPEAGALVSARIARARQYDLDGEVVA